MSRPALTIAKPAEIRMLDIALLERGLTGPQFAKLIGYSYESWRVEKSRNFPSWRMRYRIEAGLNYEVPLWSPERLLRRRKRCVDVFGIDPVTALHQDVRQFCRDRGISCTKETDVDALLDKAAVTPLPSRAASAVPAPEDVKP